MQRTPFASLTPAPPDNLLRPAIAELVSCVPSCPRLVNGKGPSDISYRVTKRSSDRTLARPPCLQVPRWHPRVAKGSSDRSSTRPPCLQVPQSHPRVTKGGFLPVFGTATLPTGASVASSRGEAFFLPVFGTEPLLTGASGASSRGEGGLQTGLRHGHPAHRRLSGILAEPL